MKTGNYLFPVYFKRIGWIISVPAAIILLVYLYRPWDAIPGWFPKNDSLYKVLEIMHSGSRLFYAICMVLLVVGLLFIAFSKEKTEDEYISKIRGDSLVWAVLVNSVLLIIAFVLIYDFSFLYVAFLNLYSLMILFVVKFRITLFRFKKSVNHEE